MDKKLAQLKTFAIISLSLIVVITIAFFVWFGSREVDDNTLKDNFSLSTSENLQVSLANESTSFGNSLQFLLSQQSLKRCSGDGQTFISFGSYGANNMPDTNSFTKLDDSSKEGYVVEVSLLLQTSDKMEIYLGKDCLVYSEDNSTLFAGAMRMAFIEVDDSNQQTLKFVWAPNSAYQMGNGDVIGTKNGERESNYGYYKYDASSNSVGLYNYTQSDFLHGNFTIAEGTNLSLGNAINQSLPLLTFEQSDTLQTKKLMIRIWFECTDRESVLDTSSQIFYNLSFVGLSKSDTPQNKIDLLNTIKATTINSSQPNVYTLIYGNTTTPASDVIYSTNGIDWANLGSGATFTAGDQPQMVYLRVAETATYKCSDVYATVIIPQAV